MRYLDSAFVTAALMASATSASAAQYVFSYGNADGVVASGTITTNGPGLIDASAMNVTDVTGNRLGVAITSTPSFFDTSYGDQQIYPTSLTGKVDSSGLEFTIGAFGYNIYSIGTNLYTEYRFRLADPYAGDGVGTTITSFTLTPITSNGAVPEPATWAMLLVGFGLVGAAARRRATRVAFAGG